MSYKTLESLEQGTEIIYFDKSKAYILGNDKNEMKEDDKYVNYYISIARNNESYCDLLKIFNEKNHYDEKISSNDLIVYNGDICIIPF